MKLTKEQTKAKSKILALAKQQVQASALCLELTKLGAAVKKELAELMEAEGFTEVDGTLTMGGQKVTLCVDRTETQVTSLDTGKLASMLTEEQFKQCASVTQKAAKEVLAQGMIDKCLTVHDPRIGYKVKASKGFPVPAIKLFK